MPIVISLLRAVNVGGHNKIRMEALRALYESIGLRNPQTYVQSGNVVFSTDETAPGELSCRIEHAIERSFGFKATVIVRTLPELRDVIASNPFAARKEIEPSRFLVSFLAMDPGQQAREKVLEMNTEPEELRIHGRELYIYFPNGMGRTKLSFPAIERALGTSGTGRNWNTVMKLLDIAKKFPS